MRASLRHDTGTTPAASAAGGGEKPAAAVAGEITVQALRESFPQWRIFWQAGEWWALRSGPVRLDGPEYLPKLPLPPEFSRFLRERAKSSACSSAGQSPGWTFGSADLRFYRDASAGGGPFCGGVGRRPGGGGGGRPALR